MSVLRDEYGQYDGPWTDREFRLLAILEDIASPDEGDERTLAVFMADIIDLFGGGVVMAWCRWCGHDPCGCCEVVCLVECQGACGAAFYVEESK